MIFGTVTITVGEELITITHYQYADPIQIEPALLLNPRFSALLNDIIAVRLVPCGHSHDHEKVQETLFVTLENLFVLNEKYDVKIQENIDVRSLIQINVDFADPNISDEAFVVTDATAPTVILDQYHHFYTYSKPEIYIDPKLIPCELEQFCDNLHYLQHKSIELIKDDLPFSDLQVRNELLPLKCLSLTRFLDNIEAAKIRQIKNEFEFDYTLVKNFVVQSVTPLYQPFFNETVASFCVNKNNPYLCARLYEAVDYILDEDKNEPAKDSWQDRYINVRGILLDQKFMLYVIAGLGSLFLYLLLWLY